MISLPNDIHRKTDRISINQFIKKNRAEIHGREEGKNFEEKVFPSMENPCHEFHQSLDGKASRQKEPRKDAATLRSDVGMLEERGEGEEGWRGRVDWWGAHRSIWRQGRVWQRVVSRGWWTERGVRPPRFYRTSATLSFFHPRRKKRLAPSSPPPSLPRVPQGIVCTV